MIRSDVPRKPWKKVLMSKEVFFELAAELYPFIVPEPNPNNHWLLNRIFTL